MKEQLSNLLKDTELEKLELLLNSPNIFSILRIENNEIRHSNFLAWLLDPNKGHNLGDRFLKWFLKDVFSDDKVKWINEFKVDSLQYHDMIIMREFKNIDILLVTNDFTVMIENKVLAKEHNNQLERYRETIHKLYPTRNHAFVFLTQYGDEPTQVKDNDVYVNYSYERICEILEIVLDVYHESLSENTLNYIKDYYAILRREVMEDDEAITIAQELYRNHKEAIDFIFENKPDRLLTILPVAEEAIKECGYIPGSQNKGLARFLTKEINDIIPRSGIGGWKKGEAFLFEISMGAKAITLKTVISPGNEKHRDVLTKALSNVSPLQDSKTKQWLVFHAIKKQVNFQDDKYEDMELVKSELKNFIMEQKTFIDDVCNEIIKVKDELK